MVLSNSSPPGKRKLCWRDKGEYTQKNFKFNWGKWNYGTAWFCFRTTR